MSQPRLLFSFGALSLVVGCAVGPDYKKPDAQIPANWENAQITQAATLPLCPAEPSDGKLKGQWWKIFHDDQLNQLEQQALEHNQSLAAAAEHLKQARLQTTASSSPLFPQVSAQASDNRFKISANRPLANYSSPNSSTVQNNPQLNFTVSYEADLFGRVRRVVESAKAEEKQAEAIFENTLLILTSDLATNYFNLRELDAEIDIVKKGVDLQKKALEFITIRHDLEAANGLELAQQQALVNANKTQLILLEKQRATVQNAIATLTGFPAPEFSLASEVATLGAPIIPVGTPADLLQRRPDVAAAERAMADANAKIGVARAAFFPSTMLLGSGGWDSNQFGNLFNAPSIMWSVGASVAQSLFDGGKIRANEKIAESYYVEAVANYRQSVLVAMQEVQTGIDSMTMLNDANKQAQDTVRSSMRVLELANYRYSGGLDIYLNVINAQESLLTNQRQAVQIHGQQMNNAVFLIKALGGGWGGWVQ